MSGLRDHGGARRARVGRILRAGVAVLLGLVVCELLMRAAGAVYLGRSAGSRGEFPELDPVPGVTILCVGDSNTFGLYVEEEEAYPARLQELLDAREPGGPHRVLNLGVPGFPARRAREALAEGLEAYSPDVALVLVGVNGLWDGAPPGATGPRAWFEDLRLVRLLRLAAQGEPDDGTTEWVDRLGRGVDVTFWSEEFAVAHPVARQALADELPSMGVAAEDAGATLVLLTYAEDERVSGTRYGLVNGWLRELADELDLDLIDTAPRVTAVLPEVGVQTAFPFHEDPHPGPLGYELVARVVYADLVALGALRGEPVGDLAADLSSAAGRAPDLRFAGSIDGAPGGPLEPVIEIHGAEPGRPFLVLLSDRDPDAPRGHLGGFVLPLADSRLIQACLLEEDLRGVFDAQGHARLALGDLPRRLDGEHFRERSLRACYVVFDAPDDGSVRLVSPAVDLELR